MLKLFALLLGAVAATSCTTVSLSGDSESPASENASTAPRAQVLKLELAE